MPPPVILDISHGIMGVSRTHDALERLNAAMARIEVAKTRFEARSDGSPSDAGSHNVAALINTHEKLREEVARTVQELDQMIEEHGS